MARRVSLAPVPTRTGSLPFAASRPTAITRARSSVVSVQGSPVVPSSTSASTPASACRAMSLRSAGSSGVPSRVNGVTSAVAQPVTRGADMAKTS